MEFLIVIGLFIAARWWWFYVTRILKDRVTMQRTIFLTIYTVTILIVMIGTALFTNAGIYPIVGTVAGFGLGALNARRGKWDL